MSRDLTTARAVVGEVMAALEAESVFLWLGDGGDFELAFTRAVIEVADLLDPEEKFDSEV